MFNIMDYLEIDQVLEDLQYDLQHSGIFLLKDMKTVNNNIMITCPYHSNGQENKPSMGISLKEHNKGTCHCFTCGTTRSFAEMVSNVFGYNDAGIFGVKWLHKKYDFVSEQNRKPIEVIPIEKEVDLTPRSWESLNKYQLASLNTNYLHNRGISDSIQNMFNIVFDPQTRHIIFPMTDENGNLLYLQSRSVDVKFFFIEENAPKAYVLFGLYQVLYFLNEETRWEGLDTSKLYVVESAIDAMYLWTYGKMAVATSQAIPTDYQINLIKQLQIKTVIAAQDNDSAGCRGAEYLRKRLPNKLVYRFKTSGNYKDINDLSPQQIISEDNITLLW